MGLYPYWVLQRASHILSERGGFKDYSIDRRGRSRRRYSFEKLFLIITEGKTEYNYLKSFKPFIGPAVNILPIIGSDHKLSLIKKAINCRSSERIYDEEIDEVWVVLDRDIDSQNKTDTDNFNKALDLAKNNDIKVAYSNDSFEVWLLLHFAYLDVALSRKLLVSKLKRHLGGKYKKNDPKIYDKIKMAGGDKGEAIKRATRLLKEKSNISPADANPSTTVHLLVKNLLKQFNKDEN